MAFNVGDSVQPKTGGRKMTVTAVNGDEVECVWGILGEEGDKRTFKAQDLSPYHEEGDFGVC
ncbi:DUF2158 domain-containing protein [Nissabacter sp. SGAir0207]|nr:DUF2158 domain-containing protein [Nissabacter sp. SGAir0207]QCR37848.1 DUF2158 domain-containing protein [Nissabacter sp. SGAir0207]